MTDKEIIKALECCIKAKTNADCEALKCPFYDNEIDICMYVNNEEVLYANALDLISRQQAEIEELKKVVIDDYASEYDSKIRAEAIKEFADRLKKEKYSVCAGHGISECVVYVYDINNLVKEMVGEG